jgi:hypothetical protein
VLSAAANASPNLVSRCNALARPAREASVFAGGRVLRRSPSPSGCGDAEGSEDLPPVATSTLRAYSSVAIAAAGCCRRAHPTERANT